ncbi:hypothetical protein Sjap_015884 [Stephania japonica]|uniref:Uncharacterized protein n=1 Tax=Stephania japonica TaxID=461633 RepID=A0AAP0IK90_9MAGN
MALGSLVGWVRAVESMKGFQLSDKETTPGLDGWGLRGSGLMKLPQAHFCSVWQPKVSQQRNSSPPQGA